MMTTLPPWALGVFELILHAEMHYRKGEDFDRRIAVVGYDNAIEVAIYTYLNLHPIQRQGRAYPTKNVEAWLENFHTKIDFLECEAAQRGVGLVCTKAEFVWYHDVRNGQYHIGGATIPQEREVGALRRAALWVFGFLFDVSDTEQLLDQHLAGDPENLLPQRNKEDDRLIDLEFGAVQLAGRPYYTSEILHAFDPVLYSELAEDIKRRDVSEREMNKGSEA